MDSVVSEPLNDLYLHHAHSLIMDAHKYKALVFSKIVLEIIFSIE